jgi:hypothetical protein
MCVMMLTTTKLPDVTNCMHSDIRLLSLIYHIGEGRNCCMYWPLTYHTATGFIDWTQLYRFYVKTETGSGLLNVMFF